MDDYDVCCGVDVGKRSHHFTAIAVSGEVVFDSKVNQEEGDLRAAFGELASYGRIRLVIDQPGSMASLLIAVAKSLGIDAGFMTPKAMARAIDIVWRRLENRRARRFGPCGGRTRPSEAHQAYLGEIGGADKALQADVL